AATAGVGAREDLGLAVGQVQQGAGVDGVVGAARAGAAGEEQAAALHLDRAAAVVERDADLGTQTADGLAHHAGGGVVEGRRSPDAVDESQVALDGPWPAVV